MIDIRGRTKNKDIWSVLASLSLTKETSQWLTKKVKFQVFCKKISNLEFSRGVVYILSI